MDVIQLTIPPLPQLLTVGHSVWRPGMRHFERNFEVYDLIMVRTGTLFMTEADIPFEVKAGELLLLEPGLTHCGHAACEEPTEIYWVHFKHPKPAGKLARKQIPWSTRVRQGTDNDLSPAEQSLFLPKYGKADLAPLLPVLADMLRLRDSLTLEHAVDLQVALGRLLSQLQAGLRAEIHSSRSYAVSEQVKAYVQARVTEPLRADRMAEELHFDIDYAARCLRKHTGMSPLQYHHALRMEEAKRLLTHSGLPVQEVAAQVGFGDYNYFIRLFRKTVGVTPGVFRQSAQRYI